MPEIKELSRAKAYAFRLLKIHPRSEKELELRLREKNFNARIVEILIEELRQKGHIDDVIFARVWARDRINKQIGLKKIISELRQKVIAEGIIEALCVELKEQYPERQIIGELIKQKFNKFLNKPIDDRIKQKIHCFLLRRGFNEDAVMDAVEKLDRSTSAPEHQRTSKK